MASSDRSYWLSVPYPSAWTVSPTVSARRQAVTDVRPHMDLRAIGKDEPSDFPARRIEQGDNRVACLHRMHRQTRQMGSTTDWPVRLLVMTSAFTTESR